MRIIKEILGVEELKKWHPLVTFQKNSDWKDMLVCLLVWFFYQATRGVGASSE